MPCCAGSTMPAPAAWSDRAPSSRSCGRRGFRNLMRWSRGVDADLFRPRPGADLDLQRPVFLYVGRVAVEKNIDAFLDLDLPGSKVVVGDGPRATALARRHPDVHVRRRQGRRGARRCIMRRRRASSFRAAPTRSASSCWRRWRPGVPVAAFPVPGPLDVIGDAPVGVLDEDLTRACLAALEIPRQRCREFALAHSWRLAPGCSSAMSKRLSARSAKSRRKHNCQGIFRKSGNRFCDRKYVKSKA